MRVLSGIELTSAAQPRAHAPGGGGVEEDDVDVADLGTAQEGRKPAIAVGLPHPGDVLVRCGHRITLPTAAVRVVWQDPGHGDHGPGRVSSFWALVTLIRAAGWRAEYEHRDRRHDVPASAAELFVTDPDGWLEHLRVWPDPDIEVMFRPWSPDEIVGDVSLFELQGQERLGTFCRVMRRIGRALGKRVALFAEGDGDHSPMLANEVDLDRVIFLAGLHCGNRAPADIFGGIAHPHPAAILQLWCQNLPAFVPICVAPQLQDQRGWVRPWLS